MLTMVKSSYPLSPYKDFTVLWTIFPMLCFSSMGPICFKIGNLCLSIPITYFAQCPPTPIPLWPPPTSSLRLGVCFVELFWIPHRSEIKGGPCGCELPGPSGLLCSQAGGAPACPEKALSATDACINKLLGGNVRKVAQGVRLTATILAAVQPGTAHVYPGPLLRAFCLSLILQMRTG